MGELEKKSDNAALKLILFARTTQVITEKRSFKKDRKTDSENYHLQTERMCCIGW